MLKGMDQSQSAFEDEEQSSSSSGREDNNCPNTKCCRRSSQDSDESSRIDWTLSLRNAYYEIVNRIGDMEKKFDELNKLCKDRPLFDEAQYVEVEKRRAEVQKNLDEYMRESDVRIKAFEAELERVREMITTDFPDALTIEDIVEKSSAELLNDASDADRMLKIDNAKLIEEINALNEKINKINLQQPEPQATELLELGDQDNMGNA